MNERVMEALHWLDAWIARENPDPMFATIRAYIEGLEADKANSERQDAAVWRYLQSVSPWSPSNDMEWCDEIITGIDFLRERAASAEARVRGLERWVEHRVDCAHAQHVAEKCDCGLDDAMQENRDG